MYSFYVIPCFSIFYQYQARNVNVRGRIFICLTISMFCRKTKILPQPTSTSYEAYSRDRANLKYFWWRKRFYDIHTKISMPEGNKATCPRYLLVHRATCLMYFLVSRAVCLRYILGYRATCLKVQIRV